METTAGTLLDGRVSYRQPARGFRSGIEPVLLAAAVPARSGDSVLEAGTGAGAGLLCLASRIAGISVVGIECDAALAGLAAMNLRANGLDAAHVIAGDLTALPVRGPFDHVFANPPYHAARGTASPDANRQRAKIAEPGLFARWCASMAATLRHRGTLSLIVPASALPACLAALETCRCPAQMLLPLWPKAGQASKLVILRGVKGAHGPLHLLPGLLLHQADGSFTPAADAILRGGEALVERLTG